MQRRCFRASRSVRVVRACVVAAGLGLAQASSALNAPEEPASEPSPRPADVQVPDPHDPTRAMHPVRVAAYALHPVGVALDWILVRPSLWVVRHEPFRTIFGYEDD